MRSRRGPRRVRSGTRANAFDWNAISHVALRRYRARGAHDDAARDDALCAADRIDRHERRCAPECNERHSERQRNTWNEYDARHDLVAGNHIVKRNTRRGRYYGFCGDSRLERRTQRGRNCPMCAGNRTWRNNDASVERRRPTALDDAWRNRHDWDWHDGNDGYDSWHGHALANTGDCEPGSRDAGDSNASRSLVLTDRCDDHTRNEHRSRDKSPVAEAACLTCQ